MQTQHLAVRAPPLPDGAALRVIIWLTRRLLKGAFSACQSIKRDALVPLSEPVTIFLFLFWGSHDNVPMSLAGITNADIKSRPCRNRGGGFGAFR